MQTLIVPIADRHADYADTVATRLRKAGLRVEVDARQEKMGFKIREAQLRKIPYMLVTGDREAADDAVAVRHRTGGDQGPRSVDDFIATTRAEVQRRS